MTKGFLSLPLLLCTILLGSGCAYRGIPSHGGGMRFDVEQQLLSSSIKGTLSGFHWEKLAGKTVNLKIAAVGSEGSAIFVPGGWSSRLDAVGGGDFSATRNDMIDDFETTENYRGTAEVGVNWNSRSTYVPGEFANKRDYDYLTACILTKLRAVKAKIANRPGEKIDVDLYVLVDIMGTHRYRKEYLLWASEVLEANCQMNVVGYDPETHNVLLRNRTLTSGAKYADITLLTIGPTFHVKKHTRGIEPLKGYQFPRYVTNSEILAKPAPHMDLE